MPVDVPSTGCATGRLPSKPPEYPRIARIRVPSFDQPEPACQTASDGIGRVRSLVPSAAMTCARAVRPDDATHSVNAISDPSGDQLGCPRSLSADGARIVRGTPPADGTTYSPPKPFEVSPS